MSWVVTPASVLGGKLYRWSSIRVRHRRHNHVVLSLVVRAVFAPTFCIQTSSIRTPADHQEFPILTILALLSVASFNVLLYIGLRDTEATNALLINSSIPVWIVLFGVIFFGDTLSTRRGAGILVSLIGVAYLILSAPTGQLTANPGDLWVISSSIGWAFYSLTLRKKPSELSGLGFLTYIVFVGVCFNGLLLSINPFNEPPIALKL